MRFILNYVEFLYPFHYSLTGFLSWLSVLPELLWQGFNFPGGYQVMHSFSLAVQTSTIISLVVLALSFPVLTASAEYLFTRKISRLVLGLSIVIGLLTAGYFTVQVMGSKVILTAEGIELSSLSYNKAIDYKDIQSAVLIDEHSSVGAPVLWRRHGIGLPGYQVGTFASEYRRSIYLFRTGGPYIKLRLNNSQELIIFSSTQQQYEVLEKYLSKTTG